MAVTAWPPRAELTRWVQELLSPERWAHTERVAQLARALARRWGADPQEADVAALLHDCARELPPATLLKMADEFAIVRDEIRDAAPMLYHGPVGAAWVRARWGISSASVLEAIAVHTTGRVGMSLLARLLYVADALEPGRTWPESDKLREAAFVDLERTVQATLDHTMVYLVQKGYLVHPDTVGARNQLVLLRRREEEEASSEQASLTRREEVTP